MPEGIGGSMLDYKIFAIDFDGTLCENKWPEIGEPKQSIINFCIRKKEEGHKLILWTCRSGKDLEKAIEWCKLKGIVFHAINENLPEQIELYNSDPRKIGADYFIDDRNLDIYEIELEEEEILYNKQEEILSTFAI